MKNHLTVACFRIQFAMPRKLNSF